MGKMVERKKVEVALRQGDGKERATYYKVGVVRALE